MLGFKHFGPQFWRFLIFPKMRTVEDWKRLLNFEKGTLGLQKRQKNNWDKQRQSVATIDHCPATYGIQKTTIFYPSKRLR